MKGDTQTALSEFATQYDGGGDPQTILTDLADFTHWVTRNKIVPQFRPAGRVTHRTLKNHGRRICQQRFPCRIWRGPGKCC